jgi:prophage tail gpP-like protein
VAIASGVGPHSAWLKVDGTNLLVEHGSVSQSAERKSSSFHCSLPMSEPGAYSTLANIGDNKATIEVTTRGVTKTLITGEIDAVDFDYIGRRISVSGRDVSAKLHDNKSSEKWINKKTTDIVKELAGRAGVKVDAKTLDTLAGKMLEQDHVKLSDNVSFAYVLHKLSEMDGARWWVTGDGVLKYAPFGSTEGSYTIFIEQKSQPIRSDCLHLRVHRNVQAGKSIKVGFKTWHPKQKKVIEDEYVIKGNGGPVPYMYSVPTLQKNQVRQLAKSQAKERARQELMVRATVVGDPSVAAGMALVLKGTDYFDQSFEIDTVHHEFGMRGHTTNITARSAKQGRS